MRSPSPPRQLYGDLEPGQRKALHDLLLRLVSPGQQGEPVRTRVPRRQVVAAPDQDELVDRLVRTRLVTSDDGVLEIAHEALARAWPRLRGWLEDDVEGQRILHHLSTTADTWDALGRPASELYRGVRLAQALEWRDRPHPELNETETAFLDAVRRARRRRASAPPPSRPGGRPGSSAGSGSCSPAPACSSLIALAAGGYAAVPAEPGRGQRGDRPPSRCLRGRAAGRSPVPAHRRHQPLAAARGRGRTAGRLAGDPGEPVDRAGQASHAWSGRRRPEAATWRPWTSVPTAAGSPPPTTRTGCTSTTPPPTGCCAATTPAGLPRTSRRASSGRSAPTAASSPSSWRSWSPREPVRLLDPDTMQPTTEARLPRRQTGRRGRRPVQRRRTLPRGHPADGPATVKVTATPGLRGGLGPPLPVHATRAGADRQRPPGAGAQPGRPDPVHRLAADGVRGGDRASGSGAART